MSKLYNLIETFEKTNKILQAAKEEEIVNVLGKQYRNMNDQYNDLKYKLEKQKFEDNKVILGLKDKIRQVEQEMQDSLKQSGEVEELLKSHKKQLLETHRKIDENNLNHEREMDQMKRKYERRIRELEEELNTTKNHLEQMRCNNVQSTAANDSGLIKKLQALERNFGSFTEEPASNSCLAGNTGGGNNTCETANTSFHDCINDPYEKETKIEDLIHKIDILLNKKLESDSSVKALEAQIDKLQEQLSVSKEQCIIDRQASRNANLNVWKLEKQIGELENDKKMLNRKLEMANTRIESLKEQSTCFEPKLTALREQIRVKEKTIEELNTTVRGLRADKDLERDLRITYEQECVNQKSDIMEYLAKIKSLEEKLSDKVRSFNHVQHKNDELIAEQQRLQFKLSKIDDTCAKINNVAVSRTDELATLRQNYEMLKKACMITDKQICELEKRLKQETEHKIANNEKIRELERELQDKNERLTELSMKMTQEKEMRQRAESAVSKISSEVDKSKESMKCKDNRANELQQKLDKQTYVVEDLNDQIAQLKDELTRAKENCKMYEKSIRMLKEENSETLSKLYELTKELETAQQHQDEQERELRNLMQEINFKEGIIEEQKNCQTKMNVKSTTTIAQYKKMIEFLQGKVETLDKKKKGWLF